MKRLIILVLWAVCILVLVVGCSNKGNEIDNINDYAPIALLDDEIVYSYVDNGDVLVIGCYETSSKKKSDITRVEGFYISSGIPAVINDTVMLPVTLNTNEHKLLMVNVDSGTSEIAFSEFNSYPIDTVSAMNTDVYMLSTMKDDVAATSYIRKYNKNTGNMDICIEKQFTSAGEQIAAFACGNENVYVMVYNMDTENDTYIEIYDGDNFNLLGKLYFDSELQNFVSDNGIVEFYCYDSYIYIRNYSDCGVIGKIENNQIKTFLDFPNLRMSHNCKNTPDNYYGFFVRSGKDFYFLDIYTDTLYKTSLELLQDESIRSVISDGNNICISIMDERDTESFTTKKTIMTDYNELKEKARQIK